MIDWIRRICKEASIMCFNQAEMFRVELQTDKRVQIFYPFRRSSTDKISQKYTQLQFWNFDFVRIKLFILE